MKELREERKSKGLCMYCGGRLDRKGAYCIECNNRWNRWKNLRKIENVANGKCANCGKSLDRKGWFCKSCTNNLKLRARIRSAERRANGQCVQCGANNSEGSQCRGCLDMLKERRRKKK